MTTSQPSSVPSAQPPAEENGCFYIAGGLAFIPLVGIPFACFAFFAGLFTWKRGGWKLTAMGIGGILFSVALYGGLFYFGFVQRGGVYDNLRAQMSQQQLTALVKTIEFYRLQEGQYPEHLQDLEGSLDGAVSIYDTSLSRPFENTEPQLYYYELNVSQNTYYLFSVGSDKIPFTQDDILPVIEASAGTAIGYRVRPLR